MKNSIIHIWILLNCVFLACSQDTYRNPIIMANVPDPAVIKHNDYFYLVGTSINKRTTIYKSKDLVEWDSVAQYFINSPTNFGEDSRVWAPDIMEMNNNFVLAYSQVNTNTKQKGIGIAVAKYITGPYVDKGIIIDNERFDFKNPIDPSFFKDNDKIYLSFGSMGGIYIAEFDSINLKPSDKYTKIAGNKFEGSHIFKRGQYYYLFGSIGNCCLGASSIYRVGVGRATNVLGPYIDNLGVEMLDNGYTHFLSGNEKFAGPGHGSSILYDKEGNTWYVYHSYQKENANLGRMPMLDEIHWSVDNWPIIHKSEPSESYKKPTL